MGNDTLLEQNKLDLLSWRPLGIKLNFSQNGRDASLKIWSYTGGFVT